MLSGDKKLQGSDKRGRHGPQRTGPGQPVSGERFTFRATASETDGELLAFDLELTSDGAVPGPHVHPYQEERFEVVAGIIT